MTNTDRVLAAQLAYTLATAKLAEIEAETERRAGALSDAHTADEYDAWEMREEAAWLALNGDDAATAAREAEATLIQTCREALAAFAARTGQEFDDLGFAAALGEVSPRAYVTARKRVLDLCVRLNPESV